MRVPYGPTEIEHVDIYKTKRADCQRSSAGSEPVGLQGNGISSIPAEAGSVPSTNRLTSAAMIALFCLWLALFASPFKSSSLQTNAVCGLHGKCSSRSAQTAI